MTEVEQIVAEFEKQMHDTFIDGEFREMINLLLLIDKWRYTGRVFIGVYFGESNYPGQEPLVDNKEVIKLYPDGTWK